MDFCNIRISPENFATFCFATIGKLPKIHATFVCNKNVAKKLSLRHFSNVAKKGQCCKKKNLWLGVRVIRGSKFYKEKSVFLGVRGKPKKKHHSSVN